MALSLVAAVSLTGCPGEAPDNPGALPDAGEVDAGEVVALQLTGKVVDYFGNVDVQDAMLATDGLDPAVMATSASDGAYSIDVAVGSTLFVVATKTGYRTTRNQAVTVEDQSIMQNVFMTTTQDVLNQYTAAGITTPVAGTAFVAAELRRNNNTPLDGIPLTNIQLVDAANQPVAGVTGPYAFNAAGSVDTTLTDATTFGGRSRIAFFDVPAGTHTLVVTYPNNNGGTQTNNTLVTTVADGSTLALSGGGGAGMGGNAVTDPTFAMHIYPKLQRAAQGGLGCANCHTLTGPAAFLKFDDPAATVLANLSARPGAINTTTPADSLLLKKPLYETAPTPQDHPNATFVDVNDANYKLFLLWIMNGAKP